MENKIIYDGITFDDVLLVPAYSKILPFEVNIQTKLTKNIPLNIPLVSAAMDTVTEAELAIAMAREGGIGIIHRNLSIEEQAKQVDKVKRSENAIIFKPVTVSPNDIAEKAEKFMREYGISGFPVVEGTKLVGIVTNRDLRFHKESIEIKDIMTPKDKLITAPENTTMEQAKEMMRANRIEKLLIIDKDFHLKGLITLKDINKIMKFPNSCKDDKGKLRVGAAIGTSDDDKIRAKKLFNVGVDVIVIDTAHGHSKKVIEMLEYIKANFNVDVVAGNVATSSACEALIKAGADCVKVGIGPGSICTTRIIAGVGVPQITAIMNCYKVTQKYGIPIIADGGIKYSGEIPKAIASGADSIMMGSMLAGTEESPGEVVLYQGRTFKSYRAMGSIGAMMKMKGSGDRYSQGHISDENQFIPEGIEGRVPYKGPLSQKLYQLIGGLRASMGYCGVKNIEELKVKAQFIKITTAGLRESHPHDVTITKESPNYSISQ